ncbi:MAG: sensor histidine kinase [Actinomycetales bacterium]|nr:sensor histidine kinase [Actinomycetales bacterium]
MSEASAARPSRAPLDPVTILAAIGGVVAWAGVVLPAALSHRRAEVPVVWWLLSVIVLVCFVMLSDALLRPHPTDRWAMVVGVAAALGANLVWGVDQIAPVFLVLLAGACGWSLQTRGLVVLGVFLVLGLMGILVLKGGTIVWAVVYGALIFFASLMVDVVVRSARERDTSAAVARELELTNARLVQTNADLAATQARLAEVSAADERLRIARELHDSMGNQVTTLSLTLELIARHTTPETEGLVADARALAAGLIRDVRGAVTQLRDGPVSLRDKITRTARSLPRPAVSLDLDATLDEVSRTRADAVCRVVQESLTNAAKHAQADHAWVNVHRRDGWIDVSVRDDGQGADPITPGHGLVGMTERVAALDGTVQWSSVPGQGFSVVARIPDLAS